jgi:TRAP transporter TAXI family solute receptor
MSAAKQTTKAFLSLQALLLALLCVSCAKPDLPAYSVGSGSPAGVYEDLARTLARVVNERQELNGFHLQQKSSAGSVANINALIAGEVQFGIAQADDQFQAVAGVGEWQGQGPQGDLRAMFSSYAEAVTLVVGADTDIRSVDDLRGKIVDIGSSGSGSRQNAIDALGAAGIDWQSDLQAQQGSLEERLSKFMKGELDAFFFTVGHPNRDLELATFSVRGARLIPLTNIDSLVSTNPYYSSLFIPLGLYPKADNSSSVETIGVRATLLTSANVADEVVYAVTKAIFENTEEFQRFHPELTGLRKEGVREGLTAPIHPGALRYFQEAGIEVAAP